MNNYQILGLSKGATQQEIKQAYRKLALKHHPDRGGNHDMFVKINKAYDDLLAGVTGEQQTTPRGSIRFDSGKLQPNGDFEFQFVLTNVDRIKGLGCLDMSWTVNHFGQRRAIIIIEKKVLRKCNYNVKLRFTDLAKSTLDKEWNIKRPKLTVTEKIGGFFKNIF